MAAAIPESLESSLAVPSVQELSIQRPEKVPPRYIRDDLDDIITVHSDDDHPTFRVPLIDMAKLVNAETQEQELQKLHLACKDWGIFQVLQNHFNFMVFFFLKFFYFKALLQVVIL